MPGAGEIDYALSISISAMASVSLITQWSNESAVIAAVLVGT